MSVELSTRPNGTDRGNPGDLFHLYCCDENRGLCGIDLTDVPISDGGDEQECVVCFDLDDRPCRDCAPP